MATDEAPFLPGPGAGEGLEVVAPSLPGGGGAVLGVDGVDGVDGVAGVAGVAGVGGGETGVGVGVGVGEGAGESAEVVMLKRRRMAMRDAKVIDILLGVEISL